MEGTSEQSETLPKTALQEQSGEWVKNSMLEAGLAPERAQFKV